MLTGPADETRLIELSVPQLLSAPGLEIVVIEGPDRGARMRIGGTVQIGAAAGNDLRLTDPTVSRIHCSVTLSGSAVRLRDHGSTNGTFVDGVRVRDADLVPGSLVRAGATTMRAEHTGEPVRIELSTKSSLSGLIGGSVAMRQIYWTIERVAPSGATVLVQGETGTGKELVARALHQHSDRAGKRFVAVDCGAISDNLIESELFGHVRGAFSGAINDRIGAFEEADGGTLFFDEVGELTLAMQRKLLRALESREIRRVGSNKEKPVDVRVIAATHRPLAQAANDGTFREDLLFRLAVVTIELPPLRSRREDIPLIAQHFLDRYSGVERLGPELLSTLLTRAWQGNVRELRNFIERRVSLGRPPAPGSPVLSPDTAEATSDWIRFDLPFKEAQATLLDRFEALYLKTLLTRCQGNVTRAAEVGGISRRFLQRRMVELGLRDTPPGDPEKEG